MNNLFRKEWSEEQAKAILRDFAKMQDTILLIIASRLESVSELSEDELKEFASASAMAEYLNEDMRAIKRAINQQNRVYAPRIAQIFQNVEDENFKLAEKYFKYRNIQIDTIRKRAQTRELIEAMQKQVVSDLLNLSHTYCYDFDGKVMPVGKAYRRIVNKAVIKATSGGYSYKRFMRTAISELTQGGIKTLYWDSENDKKTIRRADGHIRMNVMEGISRLNHELQELNGKEFGADGVETSLHALCAPDHLHYQGRQFSLDDWEKINSNLKRPWGTLNCQHFLTYIIMGVSEPVYTAQERQEAIDRSNETVEYKGRKMTRYEASQRMRAKERKIRNMRSEEKALRAAGDTPGATAKKHELQLKTAEYKKFCNEVGLSERMDRTYYFGSVSKKNLDNSGGSGIIKVIRKSVEIPQNCKYLLKADTNFKDKDISLDILQTINDTIEEKYREKSDFIFDEIKIAKFADTDKSIFITNYEVGAHSKTQLYLNKRFFLDVSEESVNDRCLEHYNSNWWKSKSLKDLVTHEIMHAKINYHNSFEKAERMYQTLREDLRVKGFCRLVDAHPDEFMNEMYVALNNGEKIEQKYMDVYNEYLTEFLGG